MKKSNLMIVIVFIFLLIGPNIIYWFVKDKMDNRNYENRLLYLKPEFDRSTITSYPNNYENYFNDHLAFKNEIRNLRTKINYSLFNTSSSSKVIVGKNGWLFYNGDEIEDGFPISEFRHTNEYDDEKISQIKNKIITTRNELKSKGIDLYVWVISNKESIYFDYLPKVINVNKNGPENRIEKLMKNSNETKIIYAKDELLNGKKIRNVYYKYDTHWNDYGAYLGVKGLIARIDPNYQMNDVKIDYKYTRIDYAKYHADLVSMNSMYDKLYTKEPANNGFMEHIQAICEEDRNDKNDFQKCSSLGDKKQTILVVGDSFKNSTIQYLSKIYDNSIFIHRKFFEENIIQKYKPDIIVYETVERYSECLNDIDMLIE